MSDFSLEHTDYQDLMLYRVHEILLIASPYDSYILEEDGHLTEQILNEYLGMNLSYAPRLSSAVTANEAMGMLSKRLYDLVIIMLRISDMSPISLSESIKKLYPDKPVVLLAFDESELQQLPDDYKSIVDNVFIWSGNANVFPAIIKYIEDTKNVNRDTKKGDIRSIILVEDTPRYFSSILPIIYKIIVFHTKQLIDKSLNDTQKLLHLRARPKILLANNYEEAKYYFDQYKTNILGIISDIRFPKSNQMNSSAGILFAKYVKSIDDGIPIILQTTDKVIGEIAKDITDMFLNKNSTTLFYELRDFITKNFGFGDFIFENSKGETILRANNIKTLLEAIRNVEGDMLEYHASKNHFSNWLAARGEFKLANQFRQIKKSQFSNPDDRRTYHISLLENKIDSDSVQKTLVQFMEHASTSEDFVRIGKGSLGGKARGLAFVSMNLHQTNIIDKFPDISIRVPQIAVISTDEFDTFMESNNLWKIALDAKDDDAILHQFLKARLSRYIIKTLKTFLNDIQHPLAIRSSGLLEDSQYQPLAGMYSTFMLPNSSSDKKERLSQVCEAIKRIYASTFFQEPKSLLSQFVQRHEEEKMAIIIMEMIGKQHNERFYPTFSGVAQSYNYYPTSYMNREDGAAFVALGLGKTIADGNKCLRFSPKHPNILSQFYSSKSMIENSQHNFLALDLNDGKNPMRKGESNNLKLYDLKVAEKDKEANHIASVLSMEDGILRDNFKEQGPRILNFQGILKYSRFPLSDIIIDFLRFGELSLGCPVEIEFAVNLYSDRNDEFCILQIKPMVIGGLTRSIITHRSQQSNYLCHSNVVLGDGFIENLKHIIYVDIDRFDISKTQEIADEISDLNFKLGTENPYVLIGPGRWGSADPWLGIPVNWKQINNSKVIIELSLENLEPDPSFGSHFFQNVTSLHIGYFSLNKRETKTKINWDILNKIKVKSETKFLTLFESEKPFYTIIDGTTGEGIITYYKDEKNDMDESNLSGI